MSQPQRRVGSGSKRNPHSAGRTQKRQVESLQQQVMMEYYPTAAQKLNISQKHTGFKSIEAPSAMSAEKIAEMRSRGIFPKWKPAEEDVIRLNEITDNPPKLSFKPKTDIMKDICEEYERKLVMEDFINKHGIISDEETDETIIADDPVTIMDVSKSSSVSESDSMSDDLKSRDEFENSDDYHEYLESIMDEDVFSDDDELDTIESEMQDVAYITEGSSEI